jgi:hypothetical protein
MNAAMISQYIATALWSSNDESTPAGGQPFDENYSAEDLTPEALETMRIDCEQFAHEHYETIVNVLGHKPNSARKPIDWSSIGHDFWLNRNGHGCGFWDGDYPEPQATILDEASEAFGECDLYLGEDGRIHCSRNGA